MGIAVDLAGRLLAIVADPGGILTMKEIDNLPPVNVLALLGELVLKRPRLRGLSRVSFCVDPQSVNFRCAGRKKLLLLSRTYIGIY